MKLRREIRAYIEAELRDYHQTKIDLVEAKEDIMLEGPLLSEVNTGSETYKISRPTEDKTLRLVTNKRIKRMEQIIRAIETVVNSLPEEKYRLVELRYWSKPRTLTDDGIALEINCDRRTIYRWLDGILMSIAAEMGECHKVATFEGA